MRKFSFRLQHLLNMRTHDRKEVELRLGIVTEECNRIDAELNSLARRRSPDAGAAAGSDAVLNNISYRSGFFAWIDQQSEALQQKRAAAEERRLNVLEEYHEALKKEKILEKLRERREQEYYRDAVRREERHVEDIVTDRYIRQGETDGQ